MIGIIVPVYNHPQLLYEALLSLTTQTKKNFLTIICDDASTEDLSQVINEFRLRGLHIIYLRSDINKGPGGACNLGLNYVYENNIESVMFLDSDDLLFPNAVETLSHELNHGLYDYVASSIAVQHQYEPLTTIPAEKATTWRHGKIYRTTILKQLNSIKFSEKYRTNEDLAFNLTVRCNTKNGAFINNESYLWRDNKNSITRKDGIDKVNVTGQDYIRAIYDVVKATIALSGKKYDYMNLLPSVVSCYNYYQVQSINSIVDEDVEDKLVEMFSLPQITGLMSRAKNWTKLDKNISSYEIINKKIIPFTETFFTWLGRYFKGEIK